MDELSASKTTLWSVNFMLAALANFLMGFSFYLLMPTLPFYLSERFHVDNSTIGMVVSVYVIAALLIRPFSGYLVDSFNRKWIYMISFLLFVGFTCGYLIAGTIFFLIILRILHGFSWGVITTSGNTLAIDIMPADKRGQGIGLYGLAFNFSMAIGPVAGIYLYQHYSYTPLFYAAIATGLLGMICAQFIQAPAKPVVKHHKAISLDRFLLVKGIPVGLNLMLITIPYGMILSFAAVYGKEVGAGNPGMYFILLAVGIGIARALCGKMIDGGKIRQAALIGLVTLAVALFAFSLWKCAAVYYLSALVAGVGYGISFPAFQTLIVNMVDHRQRGTANSTFYTAFDLGVGIGMLLAGEIASTANLSIAFAFGASMCIVAIFYFMKISKT